MPATGEVAALYTELLVREDYMQLIGFRTVAEGVETAATLHDVQSLGIGLAQGYITTRPIPFSRPSDGWIFASGGAAVLAQSQA